MSGKTASYAGKRLERERLTVFGFGAYKFPLSTVGYIRILFTIIV